MSDNNNNNNSDNNNNNTEDIEKSDEVDKNKDLLDEPSNNDDINSMTVSNNDDEEEDAAKNDDDDDDDDNDDDDDDDDDADNNNNKEDKQMVNKEDEIKSNINDSNNNEEGKASITNDTATNNSKNNNKEAEKVEDIKEEASVDITKILSAEYLSSFNDDTINYFKTTGASFINKILSQLAQTQPNDPRTFTINELNKEIEKEKVEKDTQDLFTDGSANYIVTASGEKVEADTGDYDLPIQALIFPSGQMPINQYAKVSVSYSSALLKSWLKQPGPCCAATSIAGTMNALNGVDRSDKTALGTYDVLNILKQILETSVNKMKLTFERNVGASIDPLIPVLDERLAKDGKALEGRKDKGVKSKQLLKYIKEVVMEYEVDKNETEANNNNDEVLNNINVPSGNIFVELRKLFEKKNNTDTATTSTTTNNNTIAASESSSSININDSTTDRWNFRKDLNPILSMYTSVKRLQRESKVETKQESHPLLKTQEDKVETLVTSFEQRIGGYKLKPLIKAVETELNKSGRKLSDPKDIAPTPKEMVRTVRQIVTEMKIEEINIREPIFRALKKLYDEQSQEDPNDPLRWHWRKDLNIIFSNVANLKRSERELKRKTSKKNNDKVESLLRNAKDRLDKLQKVFEERVDASLQPLYKRLSDELGKIGKSFADPKEDAPTSKELMKMVRQIITRMNADELEKSDDIFKKLNELYKVIDSNNSLTTPTAATSNNSSSNTPEVSVMDNDDDNDDGEELSLAAIIKKKKKSIWSWRHALTKYLSKLGGLRKLDLERPSTGAFGTWVFSAALKMMPELIDHSSYTSVLLLATKRQAQVLFPLSYQDDTSTIEKQWAGLRSAFNQPNSVVIYHLKNHYVPIYALREFEERKDDGSIYIVREVLAARKGQRPSAWISFDECRETMLSWSGHAMVKISRRPLMSKRSGPSSTKLSDINSTPSIRSRSRSRSKSRLSITSTS